MVEITRQPKPTMPGLSGLTAIEARSAMLASNWWAVAIRGVIAIGFGLAALLLPIVTVSSLVLVVAIYLLADGVFAIVAGIRAASHYQRWLLLILEGVANLVAGFAAATFPGLTLLLLITVLGVWSVITGAVMLAAGFRLHGSHGRVWLILSGLFSLVWGVLLYLAPIQGAVVLLWWLGAYALAFGALLLILAFRLRNRHGLSPATSPIPY